MIAVRTKKDQGVKKVGEKAKKVTVQKVGLVCAEGERCFWSNDGKVLATLKDLEGALVHMNDATFRHHVTSDKNDFADWVEFVLLDKQCADTLRTAKTKKGALTIVSKALAQYVV